MNHSARRRDEGFTLVEMLIVVVVLGVLATVVVFAVQGIRTLADENSEATDARVLETAEEGHMALHGVYADEATLVTAGLLREESQMFDINVLDGGEAYELIAAGSGGGGGGGGGGDDEDTAEAGPGDPGGPPAEAVRITYAGDQEAWSYGAPESPKKLVIIGNGSGSAGQQLWNSIASAEIELADTQVIWFDGVSTAAEVDAILAAPHTYIIVPVAVPISGGTHAYAGQYIDAKPDEQSPNTFWWGQGQQQAGFPITEAIPYYLATFP